MYELIMQRIALDIEILKVTWPYITTLFCLQFVVAFYIAKQRRR